jgi:hypothetical protein
VIRNLAKDTDKGIQYHVFLDRLTRTALEEFAKTHAISFTEAVRAFTLIADQTIKLAERGLDIADYSESL